MNKSKTLTTSAYHEGAMVHYKGSWWRVAGGGHGYLKLERKIGPLWRRQVVTCNARASHVF